jgi:hypothetical protein
MNHADKKENGAEPKRDRADEPLSRGLHQTHRMFTKVVGRRNIDSSFARSMSAKITAIEGHVFGKTD